jgi:hypothetical protein
MIRLRRVASAGSTSENLHVPLSVRGPPCCDIDAGIRIFGFFVCSRAPARTHTHPTPIPAEMVRAVRAGQNMQVRAQNVLALGGASRVRAGVRAGCEHRKRHASPPTFSRAIGGVASTIRGVDGGLARGQGMDSPGARGDGEIREPGVGAVRRFPPEVSPSACRAPSAHALLLRRAAQDAVEVAQEPRPGRSGVREHESTNLRASTFPRLECSCFRIFVLSCFRGLVLSGSRVLVLPVLRSSGLSVFRCSALRCGPRSWRDG